MPIYKNTFQPFFPDPDSPAPLDCGEPYCWPIAAGDVIEQEWLQTPCSGNLVEDPTFESVTLGAELVTNGTFTGSAAGWTLDAPWAYGSNAISYSGLSDTPKAEQTGLGLTTGSLYRISVDATVGSGAWAFEMGDGAGMVTTDPQYATGTFTDDVLHTDTDDRIAITPATIGNVLTIDNVSVKEVVINDWETSGIWNLSGGQACKTIAGTGLLYNLTADYIETGNYYIITVVVSNYGGAGTLTVYVDDGTGSTATNSQTPISANGEYTYYINNPSQDGVIGFNPSSDFTGCISSPAVNRLRNDFVFQLINAVGDVVDISASAEYTEDRVLLSVDFSALLQAGTIADYGCYTITVTDACLVSGDDLLTDGDFDTQDYGEWELGGGRTYQINFDGTGVEFIFEPLEGSTLVTNGDFSGGTTGWTGFGGGDWTEAGNATHVPGNTTPLLQNITFDPLPAFPDNLFCWVSFDLSGRTAGTVHINVNGQNSTAFATNDTGIVYGFTLSAGGAMDISFVPTSAFDGTIDNIAVHQTQNVWPNYPALSHVPTTQLITGGNYNVDYDIVSSDAPGQMAMIVFLDYNNPNQGASSVGAHSHTFSNYQASAKRVHMIANFVTAQGYYKAGRIKIDDVSLYAVEPFEATFTSECLNFQQTHSGTTLVTAWCNQDSLGSIYTDAFGVTYTDQLGFETSGFILQMRLRLKTGSPTLPTVGNNAFFGNGSAAVKYAQIEKYWQMQTDYVPESVHTTLAGMVRCDHFTVGDEGESATEYLVEMEDYSPAWRSESGFNQSSVILNIRKKEGGMKFMRHT